MLLMSDEVSEKFSSWFLSDFIRITVLVNDRVLGELSFLTSTGTLILVVQEFPLGVRVSDVACGSSSLFYLNVKKIKSNKTIFVDP